MDSHTTRDAEPSHTFDWTGSDTPSTAVVVAVAEAAGDDPTAIEPLYGVVDPDSLNDLFARPGTPQARVDASVQFEYHGYRVVVEATGRGSLYELDDRRTAATAPLVSDVGSNGGHR